MLVQMSDPCCCPSSKTTYNPPMRCKLPVTKTSFSPGHDRIVSTASSIVGITNVSESLDNVSHSCLSSCWTLNEPTSAAEVFMLTRSHQQDLLRYHTIFIPFLLESNVGTENDFFKWRRSVAEETPHQLRRVTSLLIE